ncbi:MAG TPA: FtsQ-type POTRA domain-containing protein [Candidatus Gordonibacter avicola]|nr:FtsQ-type POTRA domain-containing protein [Candidatus Gordonibacter avicola]
MASNYNRKSASSGSRSKSGRGRTPAPSSRSTRSQAKAGRSTRQGNRPTSSGRTSSRPSQAGAYRAMPGGRYTGSPRPQQRITSVRVGDLDRAERAQRAHNTYRRHVIRIVAVLCVVAALVGGGVAVYYSDAFAIENVTVSGVEHLTANDMTNMANVPANTTLLRVDASGIRERLLKNSWVKDAQVKRVFPNTLELAVTERTIAAVVHVPTEDATSVKQWAIASDHMWLMPIPDPESETGKATSPKVYEDAAAVLAITDVPYATKADIGTYCSDDNVNNALDIVSGLTTDLADHVTKVSAAGPEETKLELDSGVEIAFGKADDIREKERVCLKIMEDNPDVVYINVRAVERPTWRAL